MESFQGFADEYIIVDNGSTDNTITLIKEWVKTRSNATFLNCPNLIDLYQNRQVAFEASSYNWVFRCDADFIAYTEGPNSIRQLRQLILNTKRGLFPIAIGVPTINLIHDYGHCCKPLQERASVPKGFSIAPVQTALHARIIQVFPGMAFIRRGRWEGVRYHRLLRHVLLPDVYWFHCEVRDSIALFRRSERTNWRELGDYKTYPTLDVYLAKVIFEKYQTQDMSEAAERFYKQCVRPYLIPYSESDYYPYPTIVNQQLGRK